MISMSQTVNKGKWCGKCGHSTIPDPITNRCPECHLKVRNNGRATNSKGRIKRRDTVKRY